MKIAIFISGAGSNMKAILEEVENGNLKGIEPLLIVSDNPNAGGISIAQNKGYSTYIIQSHLASSKSTIAPSEEEKLSKYLKNIEVELICLAGFLRIIKKSLLLSYPQRIINIHPSLLPDYPGLNVHTRVLEAKEKKTGCSVHLVDEGIDTGRILGQKIVPIKKEDTVVSLSNKVIKQEHILYPEILKKLLLGKIKI